MSKQKKFENRLNNLFEDFGEEKIRFSDEAEKLLGWSWKCDAGGHYTSITPEVVDILGIQPSAFIGKLITDFCLTPQSADDLTNVIYDNTQKYKEITLQFLSNKENIIPLRVHIFTQISETGEIVGSSGFTQVIQPEVATSPTRIFSENSNPKVDNQHDIPHDTDQPGLERRIFEVDFEDNKTISDSSLYSSAGDKSLENKQMISQLSSSEIESAFEFPLSISNQANDLLEIIDPQIGREWKRDELTLVEEVAEQLSLAMENARLFEETQISLSRTEALYRIGQETMTSESLESLVQSVINTITNLLPSDQTQAAICDLNKGKVILLLESNKPPSKITESTYSELMDGVIGQCLRERKPILLPKSTHSLPKPNNQPKIQSQITDSSSTIIVPLIYRDSIFGTLKVTNSIDRPDFTQTDLELLVAMSNQISAALANAQSFEQEQRRRRIAATLSETARVIGGSLELEQISKRLLTKISEVIDFYKANLYIIEKDQIIQLASYFGGDIQEFDSTTKIPKSVTDDLLINTIYKSNQPLLIKDTRNDPQWDDSALNVNTKSYVAVPILRGELFIGLLMLDHLTPHAFDEETVDLLSGISAQAAIAIHNARLYQQSEYRRKQLQTAAEVSRAASSILEPNPLIQQTVNLIQERFDLYYVGVFLIDMDGNITQDPGRWAVLRAGTGDPGRIQVKQKHKLEVGGTSMIGKCIAISKPQISQFVQVEEQRFNNPLLPDTRSEMALPLISRGTVIGAMTFQSTSPDAFSDDDIAILQTMADQVANALQNASLFDQIQVRAEELAVLNEMSRQLTASVDAGSISRNMYFFASRLLDTSTFYVALYNRQTDSLTFPYATEDNHEIAVKDQANRKGLTKYVIEKQQPLLIRENINEWMENHGLGSIIPEVENVQISQSWLGVPMIAGDDAIGIINVQHKEPYHYSERDLELLIAIATQSAIAFQNASLFGETRQRTEDLAVLNEMSRVLANVLDINKVINTVHKYTSKLMDTTHFFIALYDSVTEEVKMPLVINENQRIDVETRKLGSGLSDYIIRSHQPLLLNDDIPNLLKDLGLDFIPIGESHIPLSWLGVPMMIGERVIGVLAVQSFKTPYLYQDRHRGLLASIASQAAITIQNTRLFDQTQQQLADLTNIQQTTSELSAAITLDEVINSFLENLVSSIKVDSISLFFVQENNLIRIGQYPEPRNQQKIDTTFSLDKYPLTKNVIKTRRPIAVSVNDPRLQEHAREALKANGISGNMTVPLVGPEGVLGVISLNRKQPGNLFSQHEINLTETLASQATISIQNAQLFEQTRRQLRDLETISSASQKLASAPLELINVAEIIAHIFIELIGVESTASISMQDSKDPKYMETYISLRKLNGETIIDDNIEQWNFHINDYPATANVMKSLQPIVVQAYDPEANPQELTYMKRENVKTLVIFPLAVKRQSIGIIELEYHENSYNITDEELSLGLTLANQAAVALDNARLYVEQRETAEQLREIDTLKSQFLANMSHELRTPLNSIIGFSRVIMKGIDGPVTDLQKQDLSAIYNAGQHLLSMINDILDISKIEAGKMELAFDDVYLPDIIESVLSTARGLIKDKPVKLVTAIEQNLPVIKADPTRIRQILLNLISNASKFTDEGSITVTARKQTKEDGTKEIYLAVTDTGTGIDIEDQKKLFVPFSQVDGSPTRKKEGTGLGLSITRLLVELHNGVIGVESEPGHGSIFWFTLPLPESDQYSVDKASLTVLSIDKDPQIIHLYEQYLNGAGYNVIPLTDPAQALEQARQILPFAITLDIMMPDFDSWNLLKKLKSDPHVGEIPVVVCSILNDQQKGFEYGAEDYLTKPILEDDLIQVMEKIKLQKTKNIL